MRSPTPLLKIFYVSRCADSMTLTEVRRIIGTSQMRNRRSDITGVLAYTGHHFAQALEGDAAELDLLMRVISEDPRHEQVRVVARQERASARDFERWSMHLLDSPDLDAQVEELVVTGPDGGSLVSRTLERIKAMVRWEAGNDDPA